MKRKGSKALLMLMVCAISLAGCGGPTEERDLPVKVDPIHQDGPQTQDPGVPEIVVRPVDQAVDLQPGPTGPVEAQWQGVDQPEVSALETIQLRIRNVAPVLVTINVEMVLIKYSISDVVMSGDKDLVCRPWWQGAPIDAAS